MYITPYYPNDQDEALNPLYLKQVWSDWEKLRDSEKKFFIAVAKVSKNGKEWVTREQIASHLGKWRLIPYNIKLLNHLSGGTSRHDRYDSLRWIDKMKRPRWRMTYEGRRRPAGYEWVYRPEKRVIEALLEADPSKPKPPAPPPEPKPLYVYRESPIERLLNWLGL